MIKKEVGANWVKHDVPDYEALYWEPASHEEELMAQLSKLGVPLILSQSIE